MLRMTTDYRTPRKEVQVGIPQGSPLSPPLYIIFNNDLVRTAHRFNV